jgi:phosphoglycolate phosphatase-like HAD superfamily hydrolase
MSGRAAGGAGRRAVVFDLDGTLLDLPVDIEPARAEVGALLAAAGHPGRPSPILGAIAAAVLGAGADGAALRSAAHGVLDRAELVAAARATARPGAAEVLGAVIARGLPLAIVTDNGRACVAPALVAAGLDRVLADPTGLVLVSRDDVVRAKPAPDGLIAAARRLLPDGGELLWLGDSPRDVAAGLAARASLPGILLTVVAIGGGDEARSAALRAAGPDRLVDDLAAALALVG